MATPARPAATAPAQSGSVLKIFALVVAFVTFVSAILLRHSIVDIARVAPFAVACVFSCLFFLFGADQAEPAPLDAPSATLQRLLTSQREELATALQDIRKHVASCKQDDPAAREIAAIRVEIGKLRTQVEALRA